MIVILGPLVALTTSAVTLTLASLRRVGGHGGSIDEQQRREVDVVAGLALHFVDDEDVSDGDLLLTAACANDRVHLELTLLRLFGADGLWNRHMVFVMTSAEERAEHVEDTSTVGAPTSQTTCWSAYEPNSPGSFACAGTRGGPAGATTRARLRRLRAAVGATSSDLSDLGNRGDLGLGDLGNLGGPRLG